MGKKNNNKGCGSVCIELSRKRENAKLGSTKEE